MLDEDPAFEAATMVCRRRPTGTFRLAGEGAPAMLNFSGGVHYRLGAHLARIELEKALTVMARRMPAIRQTGPVPWKPITGITGPATLPVEFTTGP